VRAAPEPGRESEIEDAEIIAPISLEAHREPEDKPDRTRKARVTSGRD
jgi:hypothetical protein